MALPGLEVNTNFHDFPMWQEPCVYDEMIPTYTFTLKWSVQQYVF